jgi:hypothetical protein
MLGLLDSPKRRKERMTEVEDVVELEDVTMVHSISPTK